MLKPRRLLLCTLNIVVALTPCVSPQEGTSVVLRVVNDSSHVIQRMYVSPSRNPRWGDDLLKGHSLRPRTSISLRVASGCDVFDLRLVADEDVEYLDEHVELCDDDVLTVGARTLTRTEVR